MRTLASTVEDSCTTAALALDESDLHDERRPLHRPRFAGAFIVGLRRGLVLPDQVLQLRGDLLAPSDGKREGPELR